MNLCSWSLKKGTTERATRLQILSPSTRGKGSRQSEETESPSHRRSWRKCWTSSSTPKTWVPWNSSYFSNLKDCSTVWSTSETSFWPSRLKCWNILRNISPPMLKLPKDWRTSIPWCSHAMAKDSSTSSLRELGPSRTEPFLCLSSWWESTDSTWITTTITSFSPLSGGPSSHWSTSTSGALSTSPSGAGKSNSKCLETRITSIAPRKARSSASNVYRTNSMRLKPFLRIARRSVANVCKREGWISRAACNGTAATYFRGRRQERIGMLPGSEERRSA